jgi:hypothetical protein
LLKTPDVLCRMLEVGCEVMGPGAFSLKTRLGVDRPDELHALMERINAFPLRFITLHARTARQMYEGECDRRMAAEIASLSRVPVVENGDLDWRGGSGMVGRSFVRHLGERDDSRELAMRYLEASVAELKGPGGVLGRMKELIQYWKDLRGWSRLWPVVKIARTLDELRLAIA